MKILKILEYTIPMFGNIRCMPYGKLLVSDGTKEKVVNIKDDKERQYFTFDRKRFYIKQTGSLYNPNYELEN